MSVDNCRLFVGGVPRNRSREEILEEMRRVTEGVLDVFVYPCPKDRSQNRGFAFVEYESHRAAAMARRKLIPGRIPIFGQQLAVDWAEPERDPDENLMNQVRDCCYLHSTLLPTFAYSISSLFHRQKGIVRKSFQS